MSDIDNSEKKTISQIKIFFSHLAHSFRRIGAHINVSTKLFYRRRLTIFLFIVIPIILVLLFGSIFAKQSSFSYEIVVQNKDASPVADLFVNKLESNDFLTVTHLTDLEADPRTYMQENGIHACLVIPVNWYTTSVVNPVSNAILIIDPYLSSSDRITHIVENIINEFNLELNSSAPIVNLETETFNSELVNYIDFFLPGVLGVIILNVGIIGTLMRHSHYQEIGLFKKFATTPLTKAEYVIAEIIWQFVFAIIAILLAVFTSWAIFDFSWASFNIMIIPITFIGVVLFFGIGLLLSLLVRKPKNALLTGITFSIPFLVLSGIFFDVNSIRALEILSKFSPLTYIVEAFRASMITANYSLAGINLGIALAIGLVAIIIGVFTIKWEKN